MNNLLIEPEDDSVIENYLQEVMNTHQNMGESHARGVSLSKGIKIKRKRLRDV